MVGFHHGVVTGGSAEPELIDEAILGEGPEGPVDGGQADVLALGDEGPVEVLGRGVVPSGCEGLEDPLPLGGSLSVRMLFIRILAPGEVRQGGG